eukprot:Opistho-2@44790
MVIKKPLRIGSHVNIQRSDGRVHAAIVSGYRADLGSVAVEWYEGEETKGKEIDVNTILNLNTQYGPFCDDDADDISARPSTAESGVESVASAAERAEELKERKRAKYAVELEKLKQKKDEKRPEPRQERYVDDAPPVKEKEDYYVDPSHPNHGFDQLVREWRRTHPIERRLTINDPVPNPKICVCVRKRPLNKKERARQDMDVLTIHNPQTAIVHQPVTKVDLTKVLENQPFRFDIAFEEDVPNATVYHFTAKPLVAAVFEGAMATCFAYGQTGSGKTYTMGGGSSTQKGVYALAASDMFALLRSPKYKDKELSISVSFFEIYSGKVYDLLNEKKKLRVLEDGKQQVNVVGLTEVVVNSADEVHSFIKSGTAVRTSGQTSANDESSRSHAVFQMILRRKHVKKLYGKFSLIDLAGNERGADTRDSDRQTRLEGAEINKSLLALKECIRSLGRGVGHVPFRASKLTQVLRDSFIGDNSRTCMIATLSPGSSSVEHSLNTLRYADRVKELPGNQKGAPAQNENVQPNRPANAAAPAGGKKAKEPEVHRDRDYREDLQLLHRSLVNQGSFSGEGSGDVLAFHEAVAQLVEDEESLIEEHRDLLKEQRKLQDEELKLLDSVDSPEGDAAAYAQRLEEILTKKIGLATQLREKVAAFRRDIQVEEATSRNIQRLPIY